MERQTAVALSRKTKTISSASFVLILISESINGLLRTPNSSSLREFPPRGSSEWSYRLWNAAFPWKPEIGQFQREDVTPELAGKFYLIEHRRCTTA